MPTDAPQPSPIKKAKKTRKVKICNLCSEEGHTYIKCPLLCRFVLFYFLEYCDFPPFCRVCSKFGHHSSHCPTITCKRCNLSGHSIMVCKENKVEPEEEQTCLDKTVSEKEAADSESSRNSLGCTSFPIIDEANQTVETVDTMHLSEDSTKKEPEELIESVLKDNIDKGIGENACICSTSDLEKEARPSMPCSCPMYDLVAEHDIESSSPLEIIGGVTLLVKIIGLEMRQLPEFVKMFKSQEPGRASEYEIIADGIITSVSKKNQVFVTVKKTRSDKSMLSVKKGDLVGVCQNSTKSMFDKHKAVRTMPAEIEGFICTPDMETVLEPAVRTILKLRLSTIDVNTDIHKPLLAFRRFSGMVKQWKDIKIMSKRISLQTCKFAYLPVTNVSEVPIKLASGVKFGTFENLDFLRLQLKKENNSKSNKKSSSCSGPEPESTRPMVESPSESLGDLYSFSSPSSSMFSPVSDVSPRGVKKTKLEHKSPGEEIPSIKKEIHEAEADLQPMQLPEGRYGIVMISIETLKHEGKDYVVKIGCFTIHPNKSQDRFFTTSVPDFGEEMFSADLKRILSIEKVYNCGHAPPHKYTYNCPAYGAALCCQDEKISLNLFCQFLKRISTNYNDGLVLVTYSNSDTVKLLISKLNSLELSKEFNSSVAGQGDIETVLKENEMFQEEKYPHLSEISEIIADFQLGPLIPNGIPLEMWRVLCVILKSIPNYKNFIKPYCKKVSASLTNTETNIPEPLLLSSSVHLNYEYQPARTIKIEKVVPEVICIDSDSEEESEETLNVASNKSTEPEKNTVKSSEERELIKTTSKIHTCSCYDTFSFSSQKCQNHTSYKIISLNGMTIPRGQFGTFIASIETADAHSIRAVKIFRLAGCPQKGQCTVVPSVRNVYDAKVFVTMKNDSSEIFEVVPGHLYAIGNEILPKGSNIGKSDVLSTHSALAIDYQEVAKNELHLIRCEIKPFVEQMTLVQLQKPPTTCILDQKYFTVQPGSLIYVPLKNIGKRTVPIKIGSQVGKITHVQHGKGIDILLNPNCRKSKQADEEKEQINKSENPADRQPTFLNLEICLHETFSEDICFECPVFSLVTITPVTIQPGECQIAITKIAVLEDFPNLSFSPGQGLHKYLRIHQSWQVEYAKLKLSIKVLTKTARVYQKNYVALSVRNESKVRKLTIDDKFVLARGQEIQERGESAKTRYTQTYSIDVEAFTKKKARFDPVKGSQKCFEHAAVMISALNNYQKPLQINEGIVPVLPDSSIEVTVENTSSMKKSSQKGNLIVEVDLDIFKNLDLPLVTAKDAYLKNTLYSEHPNMGNSAKISSIEKIAFLDNFPQLESLTKVDFMPNRITTVLVRIVGYRGYMKNVKIIDGGHLSRFKHLKIIENIQTIFLQSYIFLSVKNFGHKSISFEEQHNILANCLYTSNPAVPLLNRKAEYFCTVLDDRKLEPNEEATVNCCVEGTPELDICAVLSMKCDSKAIKILKGNTTTEWSSKLQKNIVNISILNLSKTNKFLEEGKVFCKAKSLMHSDFVNLTIKLAEESTEEMVGNQEDENGDYQEYLEYLEKKRNYNSRATVEEYSDDEKHDPKATEGQLNYNSSESIKCQKCSSIQKIHLKCTSCLLFPLETISDTVLDGFGATTILVKATIPKDHRIDFVQTFMSNEFETIKKIHKGLGFSKNVVRKVFDAQYLFITLFDKEYLKGVKIKKGFHIGDCQVRSENAYKAAVPIDLGDTKFPVRTDSDGEILPHDFQMIKMKVEYDTPQNKENSHQLFRFVAKMKGFDDSNLSLPNVFTVNGCRYAHLQFKNLGICKERVSNKTHVGFCRSLINEDGVQYILQLIEKKKQVKAECQDFKSERNAENATNVISSKDVCQCMTDRSTESPDCESCQKFTLRVFKGVFVSAGTSVTFLAEVNLPDDKHIYRFVMVYPRHFGLQKYHREIFKSRYVFVTISAEKEDLWIKTGEEVGFCQIRTKSPVLTRLSPEVTYNVLVDEWSAKHLLPKEVVEIKLMVNEFREHYAKTSTNRHELMKVTRSVYLNPHLKLEIQPPEVTLQNMNLISISLRNTSSEMVVLPTNKTLCYVTTLLSLDHVETILKRKTKEQNQKEKPVIYLN